MSSKWVLSGLGYVVSPRARERLSSLRAIHTEIHTYAYTDNGDCTAAEHGDEQVASTIFPVREFLTESLPLFEPKFEIWRTSLPRIAAFSSKWRFDTRFERFVFDKNTVTKLYELHLLDSLEGEECKAPRLLNKFLAKSNFW